MPKIIVHYRLHCKLNAVVCSDGVLGEEMLLFVYMAQDVEEMTIEAKATIVATCFVIRKRTKLASPKHPRGLLVTMAIFAPVKVFVYRKTSTISNASPKMMPKDRARTIFARAYATARSGSVRNDAPSPLAVQNPRALQARVDKAHAGQFPSLLPPTAPRAPVTQTVL